MKNEIGIFDNYMHGINYRVTLVPGKRITIEEIKSDNLIGIRCFSIGEPARFRTKGHMFPPHIGTIVSIATKGVIIVDQSGNKRRLTPRIFGDVNAAF